MKIEEISLKQATVEIINSIKKFYEDVRQDSKGVTFALTYNGTHRTLMANFGFTKDEALKIEQAFHKLYSESDAWVRKKMVQAEKDGFVTVAFGLRVRTPILGQCLLGMKSTPREAEAEMRTAANALGQSYGLLNTRAGIEFNAKVRKSQYRHDIHPCAQIHDAQYFLIRDDEKTVLWANKHLLEAVSWQEDPAIAHPLVKLGGELSIFYPDWAHELKIPNDATTFELESLAQSHLTELKE